MIRVIYSTSKISKKILFLRMVSIKRYFFFISLLFLIACGKNEFTLDFDLSSEVTDNYNVNYFATDLQGGKTIQAVASIREGKCILDGVTKKPTLVYITARNSRFPLMVYVERGNKIKITGKNKNPLEWEVEGNEINKELSEWVGLNLRNLMEGNTDSVNLSIKNYVENHINNPVSTILILCYYNRSVDERGYSELMSSLRGEAKSYEWLNRVGRSDQLYHTYSYPARLESLIMRSVKDGADTLRIDEKNPVFLLFWQTGYDDRKILIDSLKVLEKEIPDSARIIADICLDVDSVGWKNVMKRDSLDKIKRFWAPSGMTDKTIMKLKVQRLPYFIVFDRKGQQYYRGSDLSEAITDYRYLFSSKDTISTPH